jgi:hypothetical protein
MSLEHQFEVNKSIDAVNVEQQSVLIHCIHYHLSVVDADAAVPPPFSPTAIIQSLLDTVYDKVIYQRMRTSDHLGIEMI